jgi:hypothetical protein
VDSYWRRVEGLGLGFLREVRISIIFELINVLNFS